MSSYSRYCGMSICLSNRCKTKAKVTVELKQAGQLSIMTVHRNVITNIWIVIFKLMGF